MKILALKYPIKSKVPGDMILNCARETDVLDVVIESALGKKIRKKKTKENSVLWEFVRNSTKVWLVVEGGIAYLTARGIDEKACEKVKRAVEKACEELTLSLHTLRPSG